MAARIVTRLARGAAAAALLLAGAGCSDFLAAPAGGGARLSVSLALAAAAPPAAQVDPGTGFGAVDGVRVTVLRGSVPLVDTAFSVTADSAVIRYAVRVELEEPEEEVALTVALLQGGSPRYAGSATVRLVRGAWNRAEVTMQPVDAPGRIYGRVRDLQTLAAIPGAAVTIAGPGAAAPRALAIGADGGFAAEDLQPGEYALTAGAPGHEQNTAAVRVARTAAGDVVQVGFDLPAADAELQVAGVAGRVFDPQGVPLGGATVMISGGAATNGVFKSVLTAADGTYTLPGVSLTADEELIPSFTVLAAGNGWETRRRDGLALADGKTVANVDFTLSPAPAAQVFFADGFEAALGWQVTGLWNRTTGAGIVNTAVPSQARLAPDDTTSASLPRAAEGSHYLWYGNPAAGNYLGTGAHGGTATSPVFVVPAGTPRASLSFRAWFEIESVNPATFDSMRVSVMDVAAGTTHPLALLNPLSDPNIADRDSIPFTTGGFNRAPVFRPVSVDLTGFVGRQVRIVFRFHTRDDEYNYFRGWIVDDVRVTNQPAEQGGPALVAHPRPSSAIPPACARGPAAAPRGTAALRRPCLPFTGR